MANCEQTMNYTCDGLKRATAVQALEEFAGMPDTWNLGFVFFCFLN